MTVRRGLESLRQEILVTMNRIPEGEPKTRAETLITLLSAGANNRSLGLMGEAELLTLIGFVKRRLDELGGIDRAEVVH